MLQTNKIPIIFVLKCLALVPHSSEYIQTISFGANTGSTYFYTLLVLIINDT